MNRRVSVWTHFATAVLCAGLPAVCAVAQNVNNDAQRPARIGAITRHGLAGIVSSISGSQIVMQIPENVDIIVEISPSTRVTSVGQDAALGAIRVGDAIFASGELKEEARTIQAQVISLQPERAAQMIENRRANFGRAWTAGVITMVRGESITVQRMDGQSQTFAVDQDTVYQLRDQEGSFAMLHPGERITVQLRLGQSLATHVNIAGMTRAN